MRLGSERVGRGPQGFAMAPSTSCGHEKPQETPATKLSLKPDHDIRASPICPLAASTCSDVLIPPEQGASGTWRLQDTREAEGRGDGGGRVRGSLWANSPAHQGSCDVKPITHCPLSRAANEAETQPPGGSRHPPFLPSVRMRPHHPWALGGLGHPGEKTAEVSPGS